METFSELLLKMGNKQGKSRAPPKPPAQGAAKPKLYIADGCPYVLKTLIFVAEARLQDHIEFVPDSPAAREHVAKLIGAPASFPALERPDGSCMQFPEEDKIITTLADEFGVDLEQMHVLDAYRSGVFPRYKMMMGKLMASPEVAGVWPKLFPSIGVRKVTVLGATGMVGSRLVTEAKHRGHVVAAPSSRTGDRVDVTDSAAVAAALEGQDIVICAVGPRAKMVMGNPPTSEDGPGPVLLEKVKAVVAGAAQAKVQRVLFVGGAGTLNLPGGAGKLAAADFFPDSAKSPCSSARLSPRRSSGWQSRLGASAIWAPIERASAPIPQPTARASRSTPLGGGGRPWWTCLIHRGPANDGFRSTARSRAARGRGPSPAPPPTRPSWMRARRAASHAPPPSPRKSTWLSPSSWTRGSTPQGAVRCGVRSEYLCTGGAGVCQSKRSCQE